jgi:ribosome-associated translation inhibitor RaiA
MDIIIQSLGFKAGETLESFVKRKLQALKDDRIVRANVTFFKGPDSTPENNYCEIRLEVPGNDHFVKKQGKYFETAAAECIDVLTQKLMKLKEKKSGRGQAEPKINQLELLETGTTTEEMDIEE